MNLHNYKLIVFAGPSAVGKSFTAMKLREALPSKLIGGRLYTTRKQRQTSDGDRITITDEEFRDMINSDQFFLQGSFLGNKYGYHTDLLDNSKTTIINTWPEKIPYFANREDTLVVLIQAPDEWKSLLTKRMRKRGEPEESIVKRLAQIQEDMKSTEAMKEHIKDTDVYFKISAPTSAEDELLPRLLKLLS